MKQLYIIYFESANYCGYGEHVVVWASDEQEAEKKAESYMDDIMYEQDYEEYLKENDGEEADIWYVVKTVELLVDSGSYKFYKDPEQRAAFYPCLNPEDAPNGKE